MISTPLIELCVVIKYCSLYLIKLNRFLDVSIVLLIRHKSTCNCQQFLSQLVIRMGKERSSDFEKCHLYG